MQNVTLDRIVANPWRDLKLHPIDQEHIDELCSSIHDHGFFASLKGRERNGKVELGCGHARLEAARAAELKTIPIFIDEMDDDAMLRLMIDENALQSGANAAAVMNEVAAIIKRVLEILLSDNTRTIVREYPWLTNQRGFDTLRGKVMARVNNPTKTREIGIGVDLLRSYLGGGNPKNARRPERLIREALSALKQAGLYDAIVDEVIRRHPQPVKGKPTAKTTTVVKGSRADTPIEPRRILDERTASVFKNDHQFQAFREAVTSASARKLIPVENQYPLAQQIVESMGSSFNKKQLGAPYIREMVKAKVEEGLKQQRQVNKAERDAYFAEQREAQIDAELHSALASVRSLLSAMVKLEKLAREFPTHPKLTSFGRRLETLSEAITRFAQRLR